MNLIIRILVAGSVLAGTSGAWLPDQHTWSAPWSWKGAIAESQFGLCVASGGDVNGDGIDDIVIAAPYDSSGGAKLGSVYVVFGDTLGWQPELDIAASADASFRGEVEEDHPGGDGAEGTAGLAIVPSVNGDAYDDIVIVSPKNDQAGEDFGAVYLIFGKPTDQWGHAVSLSLADARFVGERKMGSASVAPAGDVNGDTRGDFLIGVSGVGSDVGEAYLLLGRATWPTGPVSLSSVADASFLGEQANSFGVRCPVAGVPDLSGDGLDEILIGAYRVQPAGGPLEGGKAYLFFGKALGWTLGDSLANADRIVVGEAESDKVGWRVCGVGDVDSDGLGDFLVSTANELESGRVLLFLGGSVAAADTLMPESTADTQILGARFTTGDALAPLGDVNGDGCDDFAVGAPLFDNGVGKGYAVFGMQTWPSTMEIENSEGGWRGVADKFWAGSSVAGGDVNGDGFPDMILGAAADPLAGHDAGAVFVIPSNYGPGADQVPPAVVTVFSAQVNELDSLATVQWNPVSVDQNGNPEQVLFYRVVRYSYYRWLDEPPVIDFAGMFPAVLQAPYSVADSSWAPWREVVSTTPPLHSLEYYSYRILAVDSTGNASANPADFTVFQTELAIP